MSSYPLKYLFWHWHNRENRKMAPSVAAATVYSKLFANRTETDPFKRPKTKIRKGKHFKKELKKQRKIKKQANILKSRVRNENVLLKHLKESYPGMTNIAKSSRKSEVVFDPTGRTINREKIDKVINKLMSKKDVLMEKLTPTMKIETNENVYVKPPQVNDAKKRKGNTVVVEDTSNSKNIASKVSKSTSKISKKNGTTISSKKQSVTNPKPKSNGESSSEAVKENTLSETSSKSFGRDELQWILGDTSVDKFFSDHWEKEPLYISRKQKNYYNNLITSKKIDDILRDNVIEFKKNIDITLYEDGQRQTMDVEGRALPQIVWDHYREGCSVRFLNPQTYIKPLQQLNASLQELFGCFVGANTYQTPPTAQGFAPHYDDIEAFILQLEGKKKWKVYLPRMVDEYLPRYSSPNFSQEEIGTPILTVTLEPGDLLYLPRGYIHQASTVTNEHSLHVTISVYQKTAWIDLLEKAMPKALQAAGATDLEFRRGLPIGYLRYAGLARGRPVDIQADRLAMKENLKDLLAKLVEYVDLDDGVDEMGKQLMHDALPPVLSPEELQCSVFENGLRMSQTGEVYNATQITKDTKVRLVRANAVRLVNELNEQGIPELHLYYTLDNSLEYQGKEPQFLILPEESESMMIKLFAAYPQYSRVSHLIRTADSEESLE
ncbi:hypothetical protein M8J77_009085 [Diaphorina citri]|nr:hypothetical protein M8J77_009085 [Diaphorina citri]